MRREPGIRRPEGKPTIRQVYAIARLLLAEVGEAWPANREEASELIERLREREQEQTVPAWSDTDPAHPRRPADLRGYREESRTMS